MSGHRHNKKAPPLYIKSLCRYGGCMKAGTGRPPYCEIHKPKPENVTTIPWPIPLKRLTAGRA